MVSTPDYLPVDSGSNLDAAHLNFRNIFEQGVHVHVLRYTKPILPSGSIYLCHPRWQAEEDLRLQFATLQCN